MIVSIEAQKFFNEKNFDAICYDDVLDAHNFFSKLEDDWQKYIPDELKK